MKSTATFHRLVWSAHLWVVLQCDAGVIELEPLLAIRPDVGIVVATMDTATVHQHTVQPVQVAHTAVGLGGGQAAAIQGQVMTAGS